MVVELMLVIAVFGFYWIPLNQKKKREIS